MVRPLGDKIFLSTNSYSKLYSGLQIVLISRSRNIFSYSYASGEQIRDFSSKLHSLLRTILKAVSAQNIIPNQIYWALFYKSLNSASV